MPKFASMSPMIVSVAVLTGMSLAALAAEPPKTKSETPKGLECGDEKLTGSGPGFKSSQEESEEAAKKDWLDKAKAIFPDAEWKTAKDANMECVKQGLYSKCFATGVPCHPKPGEGKASR